MLRGFFQTEGYFAGLVLRLALGVVILPHGLGKLLGMFGGGGFSATMEHFTQSGVPAFAAFLIIIAEPFGALGLIVGFLTRLSALGVNLIMLGAIFTVHMKHGFFMNWFGNKAGEGFEYHLLALGLGLVLMVKGAGKLSIDGLIAVGLSSGDKKSASD